MIEEKALTFFNEQNSHPKAIGIYADGTKVKLRLFKSKDNQICAYAKYRKRYGHALYNMNFVDILPLNACVRKSDEKKWQDSWKKVKAKLEASGLWKELVKEIDTTLDIGYEKMQLSYNKYWEIQDEEQKIVFLKTIDKRLIGINDAGKEYTKSSLIWSYAKLPKVKKMYFGKYKTPEVLDRIQKAIQEKKEISEYGQASYDVSFHYNPKSSRANYSEEYRGCGNGHYYIALNASHALFIEDD